MRIESDSIPKLPMDDALGHAHSVEFLPCRSICRYAADQLRSAADKDVSLSRILHWCRGYVCVCMEPWTLFGWPSCTRYCGVDEESMTFATFEHYVGELETLAGRFLRCLVRHS